MITESAPVEESAGNAASPPMRNTFEVPHVLAVRSSNRLFTMVMWLVSWLGDTLSLLRTLTPPAVWRTMLFRNMTRCTTTQGAWPFWLRGVNTIGYPG